ncbi:hypothetical protein DFJ67_3904 [Asanoa ferruginea]|uniref:DUF305 domain-containing protein n=1 Tax=Asanoa ferruginea TaxID=53367 RepID=A0A3D9ZL18_9ACTN|nr:hypothetical protein [Asanoa ferruginea]REF97897.1 hypothetical protein DFJ67_3904 [Asanoa ferruginea]
MVLTDQVRGGEEKDETPNRVRRRAVLALGAALAAGAAGGCGLLRGEPDEPPPPDPLLPLADEAVGLAALHRLAATDFPDRAGTLTPIAEAHDAHAKELARIMATPAPSPAASASAGAAAGTVEDRIEALRVAEKAGYEAAVQACLATPAHRAAPVGTIAAARATHLEALK